MAVHNETQGLVLVQTAGDEYIGNEVAQTYVVLGNSLQADGKVDIIDKEGALNTVQFPAGLEITTSVITATEAQFTFSNGAVVNIRGADKFTFNIGGNAVAAAAGTAGQEGLDMTFAEFATVALGTELPVDGVAPVTTIGTSTMKLNGTVDATGELGGGDTKTFELTADKSEIDEGGTVTYTVETTNVAADTELHYSLSTGTTDNGLTGNGKRSDGTTEDITIEDITSGSLTGTVIIDSNGVGTFTVSTVADEKTEGPEILKVTLAEDTTATVNTTIKDTSLDVPTGNNIALTEDTTGVDGTVENFTYAIDSSTTDLFSAVGKDITLDGFTVGEDTLTFIDVATGDTTTETFVSEIVVSTSRADGGATDIIFDEDDNGFIATLTITGTRDSDLSDFGMSVML